MYSKAINELVQRESEFIDQVEYGGASMFFGFAGETDICLFV